MDDVTILNKLKTLPIFTISDFRKIVRNTYAKIHLERLIEEEHVFRIMRNKFTVHDDPFLIAPWVYRNSYIAGYSALKYHGLITQLPQNIFCVTNSQPKKITIFDTDVIYKHSKYIFGYEMETYQGLKVPISLPEKAVIDSIGIIPLHVVMGCLDEIDKELLWNMAVKMTPATKRRIAFLLYRNYNIKKKVKIGRKILLDPIGKENGKLNKEYNIVDNV